MGDKRRVARALLGTTLACLPLTVMLASPAGAAAADPSFTPTISTTAGNGTAGFNGDNIPATTAELNVPTGVTEDAAGNVYIGDSANNRVRKVTASTTGIITTFAGNGTAGFSGDGGAATVAQLNAPIGTAIDGAGNVYIADSGNNRVRKVAPGGTITTVAGSGSCKTKGNIGDGGPATSASLCAPTGLAVDGSNLFISDSGHNRIREVSSGVISTFAGTGAFGSSGDGGLATKAQLAIPTGVAADSLHNIYIADTGNSEIRQVNTGGIINTFAGNGSFGFGGDGGPATSAKLAGPTGVAADSSGNVYISDTFNERIRQVTGGIISTLAGTGKAGFSGDGGPASSSKINTPTGTVATDGVNVFFADTGNQRVRRIQVSPNPVIPETSLTWLLPLTGLGFGAVALGIVTMRRRRREVASIAAS
jgi:hypothetical protein